MLFMKAQTSHPENPAFRVANSNSKLSVNAMNTYNYRSGLFAITSLES